MRGVLRKRTEVRGTFWKLAFLGVWLLLVGCRSTTPEVAPVDLGAGWRIVVRADGPRWLGPEWWRSQDIAPESLDAEHIQLYQEGVPQPVLWLDSPHGPGLLFYGTTQTYPRLGDVGAYSLTLSAAPISPTTFPRLKAPLTVTAKSQISTYVHTRLEQDLVYRSTAPLDLPWLWQSLHAPATLTLTLPFTDAVTLPVTLTLRVWGQSSMPQTPDHHIRVWWNGVLVDDHFWDGAAVETWSVLAPEARTGENVLALESPGDTEAPVDRVWLDAVDVEWTRLLRAVEGAPSREGGWSTWRVADAADVVWYNLPATVQRVLWVGADGGAYDGGEVVPDDAPFRNGGHFFRQADAAQGWLGVPWEAPAPDVVAARQVLTRSSLLGVDYLMIAPPDFHTALDPLVAVREAEGLTVAVVAPQQVYDTFGAGLPTGAAFRAMVLDLHERGQLRYLLLVGDASADPRAAWGALYVPTLWRRTAHVGDTPSDYALVADAAGVAVGRFPVATVQELKQLVAKTLAWVPTARLLLLNDDEAEFVGMSDRLAALTAAYPDARTRLDGGAEDARQVLLRWLKAGAGTLVYTGHGSLPMLGDEKFLTLEDAGAWNGPTVVAAWTCLCANFAHPTHTGLAEVWLRDRRGVVALVGPTGETSTAEQSALALAFQAALVDGATLGEALLAGWQAAPATEAQGLDDAAASVRVSFLLLGDPALRPFP